MGYICDFCGEQRSMVYCRSDAACLCLSCDRNVHAANALSKRHSRTLLCERCSSQPALVRCSEEKVSLCQNCNWMSHGTSNSAASTHKRQPINCYSGCPSASELSSIWSFVLDFPSSAATESSTVYEQGMGLMSIAENVATETWPSNHSTDNQNMGSNVVAESSSKMQLGYAGTKGATFCEEDDGLYDDFNMDEMDLNIENYDELFDGGDAFENGGMDSLFGTKDMSIAGTSYQGGAAAEVMQSFSFAVLCFI
ncbi:Zinc finger protein CONSTANS-LIKE 9 [Linum perenne]